MPASEVAPSFHCRPSGLIPLVWWEGEGLQEGMVSSDSITLLAFPMLTETHTGQVLPSASWPLSAELVAVIPAIQEPLYKILTAQGVVQLLLGGR